MRTIGRKLAKHWVLAATGAALLAGGFALYADSDNGPAWGQSDTGQWAKVMRGPGDGNLVGDGGGARFAPTTGPKKGASVFRASYGSGNLKYHGGKVMTSPKFYAVF